MEKNFTRDEIREIVNELIEKDKLEKKNRYNLAQSKMCAAEDALINTFDKEQKALYKKYCKERDAFIKIKMENYVKLF